MSEMALRDALLQGWQLLRIQKSRRSRLAVLPLETSVDGLEAWASVTEKGEMQVLFAGDDSEESGEHSSSGQLTIEVIDLQYENRNLSVVAIVCRAATLESAFVNFIESVIGRIAAGTPPLAAALGLLEELGALIGQFGAPKERKQHNPLGQIGELYVLRELVRRDPHLFEAWQGPTGSRHDFRWGTAAIEVKTHIRRQSRTVTVSSIDQLQPPDSGTLLLAELCLEPNAVGEITFESLYRDIHGCIRPVDREKFEARVRESLDDNLEPDGSWSVVHFNIFRVTPEFPALTAARLVDGALPSGVTHVTYRLDLSAGDLWLTGADLAESLQEGSGSNPAGPYI